MSETTAPHRTTPTPGPIENVTALAVLLIGLVVMPRLRRIRGALAARLLREQPELPLREIARQVEAQTARGGAAPIGALAGARGSAGR